MPRLIAVFAVLLLVFTSSCEKSRKHFTLDPVLRQYFSFANGSQWKYTLLSDSSQLETVTVENYVNGKMVWDAMDQEFIQLDLISDKDSIYKHRAIADENNASRAVMFVRDGHFKTVMEWYSASGNLAGQKGSADSFTLHPTYTVQNKTYTNVIELKANKPVVFSRLFIAPNVGVIRKELLSGKVYVLKSYTLQ
jgi:hypothetical protein